MWRGLHQGDGSSTLIAARQGERAGTTSHVVRATGAASRAAPDEVDLENARGSAVLDPDDMARARAGARLPLRQTLPACVCWSWRFGCVGAAVLQVLRAWGGEVTAICGRGRALTALHLAPQVQSTRLRKYHVTALHLHVVLISAPGKTVRRWRPVSPRCPRARDDCPSAARELRPAGLAAWRARQPTRMAGNPIGRRTHCAEGAIRLDTVQARC